MNAWQSLIEQCEEMLKNVDQRKPPAFKHGYKLAVLEMQRFCEIILKLQTVPQGETFIHLQERKEQP